MRLKHFLTTLLLLGLTHSSASALTNARDDGFFTYDDRIAPVKLEYVDFKIPRNRTVDEWGKDIGRYDFNLFKCRRMQKKLVLDQGRAMRRDMKFFDEFFERLNDVFPVVVDKENRYYPYSIGDKTPAYVFNAEIKDLYVNVCDHYDWRTKDYPHLRSGSAEIKVLWRITTPYDRRLVWEGQTSGYATIDDPVKNGEVRLVEKAFGDSLVRMTGMPGVVETLRIKPSEEDLRAAKEAYERMMDSHRQSRRQLMDSYRRNRLFFYGDGRKKKSFSSLERLNDRMETLSDGLLERQGARRIIGVGTDSGDSDGGRTKEMQSVEKTDGAAGTELASTLAGGFDGRIMSGDGIDGKIKLRLLSSTPLIRLFETYDVSSPLGKAAFDNFMSAPNLAKYGFNVSQDGWITINNEKPFRYLTPQRIYRIRSSVVAVTGAGDVSSGALIAPSLILTNFTASSKAPAAKVRFMDGKEISALVLRVNKAQDSALLYISPEDRASGHWPLPLRIDLPDVNEKFYAVGTPMKGGYEGALEPGVVSGYRYTDFGVEILTDTTVQSVTLGGVLIDEHGNAIGIAHAGKSAYGDADAFIPIGDAFQALRVRIRDRFDEETPTAKALRLLQDKDYIK